MPEIKLYVHFDYILQTYLKGKQTSYDLLISKDAPESKFLL